MDDKMNVNSEQKESVSIVSPDDKTNAAPAAKGGAGKLAALMPKFAKKKLAILGVIAVVVIAVAFAFLHKSKFEKVRDECLHIAGIVSGSGNYFTIDTYPDTYENIDDNMKALLLPDIQKNALEAIRYANEELGFNDSVYSKMMKTTALMGRQNEETDKYKVSWTYHPDNGLEVTYEKK